MQLTDAQCWARLADAHHGVLGTVHPSRGVDAVPAVYALVAGELVVPIDTVKPKRGGLLRRVANLEGDRRCVLLVEHYDEDWSELWWVRVHAEAVVSGEVTAEHLGALVGRYPAYAAPGAVQAVIVLHPTAITGWAATAP